MESKTIRAKSFADRTMVVQAPSLKSENRPWCLVVVGGPMIGARFDLGDAARVGREGEVEIRLPEPSVSRRHCHIFRKRGGYWVTDLGATNPLRINGTQLKDGPLLEGDLITIGDIVLKLLGPENPENALVQALVDQATRDQLTGIANRRHFRAAMENAFNEHREGMALIAIDVDHFKHVNDRFGHPAGDRVLSAVGAILREQITGADLPGRIGGEEFAVLLQHSDRVTAMQCAERLRQALEALELIEDGERIPVTASFGVALAAADDDRADAVYARADAALYEAKRSGRNRVLLAALGYPGIDSIT